MYLHIGNQINIRERDIVGIFDADRTTTHSKEWNINGEKVVISVEKV